MRVDDQAHIYLYILGKIKDSKQVFLCKRWARDMTSARLTGTLINEFVKIVISIKLGMFTFGRGWSVKSKADISIVT